LHEVVKDDPLLFLGHSDASIRDLEDKDVVLLPAKGRCITSDFGDFSAFDSKLLMTDSSNWESPKTSVGKLHAILRQA
jgi:hypothetical protein